MEARGVSPSGLVYLFGEEFAKPAGRLVGGETLLYSGQKVDRKDLANRLFEAAFVSLAGEGYISLETEERKKLLLLTTEVVTIAQEKGGDDLPPSLERAIMDALSGDPIEDWVQAVVERRRFRPDKVRWSAHEEAISPLAGEAETLKSTLETLANVNPDLHKRLVGEVGTGISAQEMEVDVDID